MKSKNIEVILYRDNYFGLGVDLTRPEKDTDKKRIVVDDTDKDLIFKIIKGRGPYKGWAPDRRTLRKLTQLWDRLENG